VVLIKKNSNDDIQGETKLIIPEKALFSTQNAV
jgi:hypothetical protein